MFGARYIRHRSQPSSVRGCTQRNLSLLKRLTSVWRTIMVMYLIASGTTDARPMMTWKNVGDFRYSLGNRLQRGPVPPSEPSQCHHRLNPLSHPEVFSPHDFVLCP
ncbi:PREDICTED: uncharacterized protein LOC109116998 [Tarenaya hassleriana]|uniref:uncharacterized protein LOC109116998 n=1 Tax=Tarenaya hassleriana TaxID=28532 RepID=UPI0008FD7F7E|nr:PREDICTED: uncharacterized protein LOC109116998 [Tarenaya hassleriana]